MKPLATVSLIAILFFLNLSLSGKQAGVEVTANSLRPDVSQKTGWNEVGEVEVFSPENLFYYLNGGAPQYLSFGFEQLVHNRYSYQGQDLQNVTLDIFDMGSLLGAYGIYSSIRPRRAETRRDWGSEGYRSGLIAAAWKDRFYVHAVADEDMPSLKEMLDYLVGTAISAVPGEPRQPSILSILPTEDRIPGSERMVGKDLFGHSFLPGGLLANYSSQGQECLVFVTELPSKDDAGGAFAKWIEYERSSGSDLELEKIQDWISFWVKDPGLGAGCVIQNGLFLVGVWGLDSKLEAQSLSEELAENASAHLKNPDKKSP